MFTSLATLRGGNSHYTLCALLSRMNELVVERPTLYSGGHIVSEVSANVTVVVCIGIVRWCD
jgi:hypothetical protein